MSRRSYWGYEYFHQTTSYEVSSKASEYIRRQAAKGITLHPVAPKSNSRKICQSWWGISWCDNLERYADYSNRLERGRKYVRAGAVLDLEIAKGQVNALVQGSSSNPYRVSITIDPLSEARQAQILDISLTRVKNMEELLNGKFPEEMKTLFFSRDGLFPTPREIHFRCSCPDGAYMCKHVAAVMYGVGLRLDEDPLSFFVLRGLDATQFIAKALDNKVDGMLKNAEKKSKRIISDKDVESLFGAL
ncbi:MAG: SWIM zinc finger family protein [Clostridia bacterium]|nr:SWIM zinc finger family protein [Clostridia bacterium]